MIILRVARALIHLKTLKKGRKKPLVCLGMTMN